MNIIEQQLREMCQEGTVDLGDQFDYSTAKLGLLWGNIVMIVAAYTEDDLRAWRERAEIIEATMGILLPVDAEYGKKIRPMCDVLAGLKAQVRIIKGG